MHTQAVLFDAPRRLRVATLALSDPGEGDAVVRIEASGVSTGTERLLWDGRMPHFPGMGYPLVPGYEAVGTVIDAGPASGWRTGERVFVPGSTAYRDARGLFGAAAAVLVAPGRRLVREPTGDARGVALALAATAHHAVAEGLPDLVIGHGTLGRLVARIAVALGGAPTVWEADPARRGGAQGYEVTHADADETRGHSRILDASGADGAIDAAVPRLARGGEMVLAGFYPDRVGFAFAPAFMREARLRIAAEWQPADMTAVVAMVERGSLSLDGLVTDRMPAADAPAAYERAFSDPACLKMCLDWT